MAKIKIMNGRAGILAGKVGSAPGRDNCSVYLAYTSLKQAEAMVHAVLGVTWPPMLHEFNGYFNKGLWGVAMEGIDPQVSGVGIWITKGFLPHVPLRLYPIPSQGKSNEQQP